MNSAKLHQSIELRKRLHVFNPKFNIIIKEEYSKNLYFCLVLIALKTAILDQPAPGNKPEFVIC
jgi:hypothetical protein